MALTLAGLLLGCGGSNDTEPQARDNCVISDNGQKLCGAEAKAYCEGFTPSTALEDLETARACAAAGAELTSEAAKRRKKRAAKNRKGIPPAPDFEPAVKRLIGRGFVAVERKGDSVTVKTLYTRDKGPGTDTAVPAPSNARMSKICATVHNVDPDVRVDVEGKRKHLVSCFPPE